MEGNVLRHYQNKTDRRGARLLAVCLCLLLCMLLISCTSGGQEESAGSAGSASREEQGQADGIQGTAIGTWQDSYMISALDNAPHPVKVRFTSVDTDPASVEEQIKAYNVSAAGHMIPALDDAQYTYVIAHYEVAYPEDFPQNDYGIIKVAPAFTICAADGGTVITTNNTNYSGLTETFEIGAQPQGYDFHAGDTYKGAIVYIMVNGFTDYRIVENVPAADGSTTLQYYMAR